MNSRNSRLCKSAEQTEAVINEIFLTPVKGELNVKNKIA